MQEGKEGKRVAIPAGRLKANRVIHRYSVVRTDLIKPTVVFVPYADFSKGKAVFLRIRRPGKIQP